jgi:protein-S-isoprenylcysteine O-methyltransferase
MSGVLFVTLAYVVPLLGTNLVTTDARVWVGLTAGFVVVSAQPTLSRERARQDRDSDRLSAPLILGAALVTQVLASIELRWRGTEVAWGVLVGGGGLALVGIAVRLASIAVLGPFFTATVHVSEAHQLVTRGPYRWIRHPSYLGAYLAIVGVPIGFGAWGSALVAAVVMSAVYGRRIRLEERALEGKFGPTYAAYRARTWSGVPGVS